MTTQKNPAPSTSYTESSSVHITVETVDDAILAWYELCETLTFLADVTGAKVNEKGLRSLENTTIPLSCGSGENGEIYARAAALGRCLGLAGVINPDDIIRLHTASNAAEHEGASHE